MTSSHRIIITSIAVWTSFKLFPWQTKRCGSVVCGIQIAHELDLAFEVL
jgi:hypothetical protein